MIDRDRNRIPPRYVPALMSLSLLVALSMLTRLALALRPDTPAASVADWVQVFVRGAMFDLAAGSYATAPFFLWLAIAPGRLARTRLHRLAVAGVFALYVFAGLVLALAEWLFWDEFGSRFNFIAVDYLLYTHEVIGNIWQSYPVGRVLAAVAALAGAVVWMLRGLLWHSAGAPFSARAAGLALAGAALALPGCAHLVDSDAKSFSGIDALNDLAGNGLYELFAANRRNELRYDHHYATIPADEALGAVGRALGADTDGVRRRVKAESPARRLNVVLVSVESLGAEFVGAYGDPRGLTPGLDRLAAESLAFHDVYATGNRTVRGLEALSLSIPPTPGQSIVRRPNNEDLFSLGSVLESQGYSTLFAYGGYGYFDNMNAFFGANHYAVVDRRDIPSGRVQHETVWGVADEYLFDQVLDEMDARKARDPAQPVFIHVMTTSNHRPYTYPEGRVSRPSGSGREGAVQYSDWAIGDFMNKARQRPWFRDTLFVLTADHGANARGTQRIPVDKYRIPLLFYSPAHVPVGRVDRLMSQIDIGPTLLGLLGLSYDSKFFGRDVLHSPPESDRAFVANYQTLGYLKGDRMVLLHPQRRAEAFRVDARHSVLLPVRDEATVREAVAFYEAASLVYRSGQYRSLARAQP